MLEELKQITIMEPKIPTKGRANKGKLLLALQETDELDEQR